VVVSVGRLGEVYPHARHAHAHGGVSPAKQTELSTRVHGLALRPLLQPGGQDRVRHYRLDQDQQYLAPHGHDEVPYPISCLVYTYTVVPWSGLGIWRGGGGGVL
jgi:hypothetical protein